MIAFMWLVSAASSAEFSGSAVRSLLRSPPAKKVFFAEVMTTPVMSSTLASSQSTMPAKASLKWSFIVLTLESGSSRTTVTIPSESVDLE